MSKMAEDTLAHFGVKGMKWGQRKSKSSSSGPSRSEKKLAKKDAKWEKKITSKLPMEVYNKAASRMNGGEIAKFNANRKYDSIKDFNNLDDPKVKAYHKDYADLFTRVMNEEARTTSSARNVSGTRGIKFEYDENSAFGVAWKVTDLD